MAELCASGAGAVLVTAALALYVHACAAQMCETVSGGARYEGHVLRCTVWNISQYGSIPADTEALWVIYPEAHAIHLTLGTTYPPMPNLVLLINDVTFLNDTDFQPGAFVNTDMPRLETFTILRDLNVPQNENRVFFVPDESFHGLEGLQNLYLESLALYELEADSLSGLGSLGMLSIKQNYLTLIIPNTFIHTPNLVSLNLHDNYIEELDNDSFSGLSNLLRLNLSLNAFMALRAGPLQHLQNLEILDLSSNQIATVDQDTFRHLIKLHYLAMNSNNLRAVTMDIFQDLVALETLILDSNALQLEPNLFSHLGSLRHISLSNNAISRIEPSYFNGLQNLTELFISNNLITTLGDDTFSSTPALVALDLDNNRIQTIEVNAFRRLDHLVKFSIEGNLLTSLPNGVFTPFAHLDTIYLLQNAWICDCAMTWLFTWLRDRYDILEPHTQWHEISCDAGGGNLAANETFHAILQQASSQGLCLTDTTESSDVRDNDDPGGESKEQALSDTDKVILSVCLISSALIAVGVIVCFVYHKQRKNRIWQPPEMKQSQAQHSDLAGEIHTAMQMPSSYPDLVSDRCHSAWESRSGQKQFVNMHTTGPLKRRNSYIYTAMATGQPDNGPGKQPIRERDDRRISLQSVYSYEEEYYASRHDTIPENAVTTNPLAAATMATEGTPQACVRATSTERATADDVNNTPANSRDKLPSPKTSAASTPGNSHDSEVKMKTLSSQRK